MYRDIWYQLFLFVVFFIIGAFFALMYDTLKVSEKISPRWSLLVVLKDVVFWLVVTIVMFATCLKFNDGEFRLYMFSGVALGAVLYFKTLSRSVVIVLGFVLDGIKKITSFIFSVLLFPVRILFKIINKPVIIAFSFTQKRIRNLIDKIKFKIKVLKIFKR